MSLYSRNYGSWSSKGSGAAGVSPGDKTHTSPTSTLDRTSRFGSTSGNRPLAGLSVRERTSQVDTSPTGDKPSIREKYASRSFSVEQSPEPKVDAKLGTSTYKRYGSAYSPTAETPSLRFGSSSRFGGQIARSPITEKSPTVFGVSGYKRPPESKNESKTETTEVTETITMVTRGTSPTPPSSSTFLRARRAEMDRTIEKTIPKLKPRHTRYDTECQTEEKCIEDAKLESKLSAAVALTARTPSSSSYSRYNTGYTPRTSAYHGTRSTVSSLSVSKTPSQEEVKSEPSPTKEEKSKKLEGKDTTRIGGFSYARPTDLPMTLNKAMADSDGKSEGLVSPSKIRSTSPQTSTPTTRGVKSNSQLNKPYKFSLSRTSSVESSDDTVQHSNDTPTVGAPLPSKVPLSPSRSTSKLTSPSPDKGKLPPLIPKTEAIKVLPNKDFRKSELNMNLSSSNESLSSQKLKSPKTTDSLERSPSIKSPAKLTTSKSLAKLPSSTPTPKLTQKTNKVGPPFLKTGPVKAESSESSSEETSNTDSSSSSESDSSESEEPATKPKQGGTLSLPKSITGSKLSIASSKTSAQISSADEASVSVDKPPRPPSSMKSNKSSDDARTEEASAVVVRALTPIVGPMKVKYRGSSTDESSDKESKPKDPDKPPASPIGKLEKSPSSLGVHNKNYKIQHVQSGEKAWWMSPRTENVEKKTSDKSDSDSGIVSKSESTGKLSKSTSKTTLSSAPKTEGTKSASASETEMKPPLPQRQYKLKKTDSGSGSDVPSLEKSPSANSLKRDKSKVSLYKIKRIESGERPWWLQENETDNAKVQDGQLETQDGKPPESNEGALPTASQGTSPNSQKQYPISKIESGERAWWLSDSDEANGKAMSSPSKKASPSATPPIPSADSDDSKKSNSLKQKPYRITKIESGERAWWLGDSDEPRKEPPPPPPASIPKRPKDLPLFIGRHTNIDDVLGTQAPPPAAFRTPQNSSDESEGESEEIFEVRADDVKIHDSTAMTPSVSRPNGMIKVSAHWSDILYLTLYRVVHKSVY